MTDTDIVPEFTGRWDYGSLPKNIRLGAGCFLEQRKSFERFRSEQDPGLVLGDRVRVYAWTNFNIDPAGQVEVGSDSILVGPTLMCAEHIRIGERVIISYHVTLADSDFHPVDPEERIRDAIANSPLGDLTTRPAVVSRPIVVEDDAWVGVGAIILKGVRIGRAARVGAGSVVTSNVRDGAYVAGNPAREVEPW